MRELKITTGADLRQHLKKEHGVEFKNQNLNECLVSLIGDLYDQIQRLEKKIDDKHIPLIMGGRPR